MVALVQVSWPLAVKDVMTKSAPNPGDPRLQQISKARMYLIMFEPLWLTKTHRCRATGAENANAADSRQSGAVTSLNCFILVLMATKHFARGENF